MVKNLHANAGDMRDAGLIPGLGRSPGGCHGNPLQCSCLENPVDRGAWRATVHRVAKSQMELSDLAHIYRSTATGLGSFQNHVMEGEYAKRIRYKTLIFL